MLVVLSPIFVADTKITFVYNFVAPLKTQLEQFKNLVDPIFFCVEGEGEVFRKHLLTTLKKIFKYLYFTTLVLHTVLVFRIMHCKNIFAGTTFFIRNRFVSNWR